MNDMQKLFQQMMESGQAMARSMNPAMESFDPKAIVDAWPTMPRAAMEAAFGDQFNPGGLDAKTRLLLTLGALTVQGAIAEPQIRLTVRHALEAGASPQEIAETVAQMSVFAGVPAMMKAMEIARGTIAENQESEQ